MAPAGAPSFRRRLFDLLEANNKPGMLLEAATVLLIVVNVVCFMLSTEESLADSGTAWLIFDSVELCTVSSCFACVPVHGVYILHTLLLLPVQCLLCVVAAAAAAAGRFLGNTALRVQSSSSRSCTGLSSRQHTRYPWQLLEVLWCHKMDEFLCEVGPYTYGDREAC